MSNPSQPTLEELNNEFAVPQLSVFPDRPIPEKAIFEKGEGWFARIYLFKDATIVTVVHSLGGPVYMHVHDVGHEEIYRKMSKYPNIVMERNGEKFLVTGKFNRTPKGIEVVAKKFITPLRLADVSQETAERIKNDIQEARYDAIYSEAMGIKMQIANMELAAMAVGMMRGNNN